MSNVFVTDNPLAADECVFLTEDDDRAEETVFIRCTPYGTEKTVYFVDQTEELESVFEDQARFEHVRKNMTELKRFSLRNCGVRQIHKVVRVTTSAVGG